MKTTIFVQLLLLIKLPPSVRSIRAATPASSTNISCFAINKPSTPRKLQEKTLLIHKNPAQNRPAINQHAASRIVMQMVNIDDDGFTASEITLMDRAWVLSYRLLLTGLAMAFTTNAFVPTLLEGSGVDTSSIEPWTRNAIAWMSTACVLCVPRGGINDNIASSLFVPLGISSLSLQIVNLVLVDGAADKNVLALVMAGDITTVLALCLVCVREILFFGLTYKVEAALSIPLLLVSLLFLDTSSPGTLKVLTALTISLLAASKALEPVLEDLRPGFSAFLVDKQSPVVAQPAQKQQTDKKMVSLPDAMPCLIREISAKDVLKIREDVLWPGRPEKCVVDIDHDVGTVHLGGFTADNCDLMGVVSLYLSGENSSTQFRKFAVREEYQGKGIGSQMLEAIKRYAARGGSKTLWAHAREHQEFFYTRRGFVRCGDPFQKYEDGGMYVEVSMNLLTD